MQTYNNRTYPKEQIETTLIRLNSLKLKVTELRVKCEKLKRLQKEKLNENRCKACNKKITHSKEVTFKDPSGKITQYYHKHCFETFIAYLK
ncbi:MAG: hypothetical protein NWF10_02230 [Candidatus Bathyarchaeota archaeon]|nr:hypothetical protein [Candidatus Bathyarchaeota archaeon]